MTLRSRKQLIFMMVLYHKPFVLLEYLLRSRTSMLGQTNMINYTLVVYNFMLTVHGMYCTHFASVTGDMKFNKENKLFVIGKRPLS